MADCLLIGYNEVKLKNFKPVLKLYEALKLPQLFEWMPSNNQFHMMYKFIQYSWLKHNNEPYSAFDVIDSFYGGGEWDDSIKKQPIFSSTIAYLGTFLKRRGFTFDFVNSFNHGKTELAEKLRKGDVLTVAIPTTFYEEPAPIREIVEFVKAHNSKVKIIIGGPYILKRVQDLDQKALHKLLKSLQADFYVVNIQGESALAEVLRALKNNRGYEEIKNIIYKERDQYRFNEFQPEENRLEENTVDWALFAEHLSPMTVVRTCISCPFSCAFCDYHTLAGQYQTVSVEAIERELDQIQSSGRVKHLLFTDDTFNVPVERFKAILRMMIRKKYRFQWTSFLRCQFLDTETVALIKESECEGLLLGIESANQTILDNMNKKAKVEDYRRGIGLLNEYQIDSCCSFIIGFPGETAATARDTIDFIEACRPTYYRLNTWICLPSSPVYQQRERYKIKGKNLAWSHATMNSKMASQLIEEAVLRIENSIYLPVFDFDSLSLYNWGMSSEQIKVLMAAFNAGVKEKLRNPKLGGVSAATWNRLKTACINH